MKKFIILFLIESRIEKIELDEGLTPSSKEYLEDIYLLLDDLEEEFSE